MRRAGGLSLAASDCGLDAGHWDPAEEDVAEGLNQSGTCSFATFLVLVGGPPCGER